MLRMSPNILDIIKGNHNTRDICDKHYAALSIMKKNQTSNITSKYLGCIVN